MTMMEIVMPVLLEVFKRNAINHTRFARTTGHIVTQALRQIHPSIGVSAFPR